MFNAQVKLQLNDQFAVRVFGQNLTGEKIIAGAQTQVLGPGAYPYNPARPATYGAAIDFSF